MALKDEYGTTSGNAHKGRALKRMKLSYRDTELKFAVNPEDYTQTIPNRVTVTQTKGGAWLDAWGAGIVEFTIKGTTGVSGNTTNIDKGYQRWRKLRSLFVEVFNSAEAGKEITDLIALYNYTDNEYWYCYPAQGGIELYRSKSRPHMYQYTIHLLGLREIGQPATSSGVIGNPNQATASGGAAVSSATRGTSVTRTGQGDVLSYTIGTQTKSKPLSTIQTECLEYSGQLEPIIGGGSGLISPATGYACTQGISIQSSGTVSNVTGFSGGDLSGNPDDSMLVAETRFTSKVDSETYKLYSLIRDYSPEVLDPSYSNIAGNTPKQRVTQAVAQSKSYNSTLYELIALYAPKSILNKTDVLRIKMVMLDCMNVYREVYKIKDQETEVSTTLTAASLKVLINNIRALILYFTLSEGSYSYDRMDVSNELRKLEKVMTELSTNVVRYL